MEKQVRRFATATEDLRKLAAWLNTAKNPLPSDTKRRTKRKRQRSGDFRIDVSTEAQFGRDVRCIPILGRCRYKMISHSIDP